VTKEEFQELAAAYGGEMARWPAARRDEAALLLAQAPEFARSVLAREAGLDAVLDELPRAPPAPALFERIVAGAPPQRRRRRWRFWLAPAGLGAALAGVAAAGVMLGVQVGQRTSGALGASLASADAGAARAIADFDLTGLAEDV
jgi:hypothetical protein